MKVRKIGHIGLVARDLDRMTEFYSEALGLMLSDRYVFPESSPYREGRWLRCHTDHHVLSIFDLRKPAPDDPTREPALGLHHFAFEVESFDALRTAARIVRERGLPLQGQRTGGPGNQLRLYFWDPENNMIELYWQIDQIGWDGRTRDYPEIVDVDIEEMDAEAWLASKMEQARQLA
jgi:catechol-2,3-dioxygenase